jgi:hypothetical protein
MKYILKIIGRSLSEVKKKQEFKLRNKQYSTKAFLDKEGIKKIKMLLAADTNLSDIAKKEIFKLLKKVENHMVLLDYEYESVNLGHNEY